jgi:adenylate cyclase class IV
MDRHSEVEIKFRADGLTLKQYHSFARSMGMGSFKRIEGTDTFYTFPGQEGFLRYRRGHGWKGLTFKRRKSEDSIVDRVEIDLEVADSVTDQDVDALVEAIGGKKKLNLTKTSYIHRIESSLGDVEHEATLALYDVEARSEIVRRFLEVEVERHNKCSAEAAVRILQAWAQVIKKELDLGEALNQSLFEIYYKEQ